MTPERINIAITEVCEWKLITDSMIPSCKNPELFIPDFYYDMYAMHAARKQLINTQELRVRYVNFLRDIVARRMPKNKVGVAMVSDVDLLLAESNEHCEAILRALEKWEETTI